MSEAAAKKPEDLKPEAETPVQVPDVLKPVGVNRFGLASEKRNHYVVYCKQGTDPKVVLETTFWEHVSRFLGRGDIIEVLPDDLAWEMNVRVIDRGSNWALVKKREFIDYGGAAKIESELPKKYSVKWLGQTDLFGVYFNGEVLKKGFATEQLAHKYAGNHADSLKR